MDMLHWLLLLFGFAGMAGVYLGFKLKESRERRGARRHAEGWSGALSAWLSGLFGGGGRRSAEERGLHAPDFFPTVDAPPPDAPWPAEPERVEPDPPPRSPSAAIDPLRGPYQDGVLSSVRVVRPSPPVPESEPRPAASVRPAANAHFADGGEGGLPPGVRRRATAEAGSAAASMTADAPWPAPVADAGADAWADTMPREAPRASAEAPRRAEVEAEADAGAEAADNGDRIVVLHVMAGEGYVFSGTAVVREAQALGLQLDSNHLLQAFPAGQANRTPWFGLASVVSPGVFPPRRLATIETPGVALFMRLPGPFDGVVVFERMLDTARRLANRLEGQLLDQEHQPVTAQSLADMRASLREARRRSAEVGMDRLDAG
jgi:cell division protein ZipA